MNIIKLLKKIVNTLWIDENTTSKSKFEKLSMFKAILLNIWGFQKMSIVSELSKFCSG